MNIRPILLALLSLAVCSSSRAEEKIRVGMSTALTGPAASYGIDIKNVAQFANDKLARGRFEFVIEDDKCNSRDAVSVAQKLINVDHVKYVIGLACSAPALSSAPLYEKAKIVTIISSASTADIRKSGEYIFRTVPSDAIAAEVLYGHLAKKHKVIGILSEETDYAQGLARSIAEENWLHSTNGIRLVNESFLSDVTDFRSVLLRLKNAHLDSLVVNPQSDINLLAILRQSRQLNLGLPLYTAYWPSTQVFLEKGAADAEGMEFVDTPALDGVLTADGQSLYRDFKARFGGMQAIELYFGTTFEAVRALSEAIDSGEDVREFLLKKEFNGVYGKWHFDRDGEIVGVRQVMKVLRHGKPETLPPTS